MDKQRRIFISVAEASADIHAASLILAARESLPNCVFYGLTGPRMRAAGAETLGDMTQHAAMLTGVAGILSRALEMRRQVEASWRSQRPDVVVLLDSPEFHLNMGPVKDGLAPLAKSLGLRVLYYIAPQTWASRPGRNKKLAACVDSLACILPFEEAYFRSNGVSAEFVGHPLFESLKRDCADDAVVGRLKAEGRRVLGILPGSREHVIDEVLPLQLQVVQQLRGAGMAITAAISCVSDARRSQIAEIVGRGGTDAEIIVADNSSLLTASDLVLVASGTATLDVAWYRKPMIVMYNAGGILQPLYRLLGKRLISTPHLSLINILAGARVVPEFMPFVPDVAPVAKVAQGLLTDQTWRQLMVRQIGETIRPLHDSRASANVCRIIERMM